MNEIKITAQTIVKKINKMRVLRIDNDEDDDEPAVKEDIFKINSLLKLSTIMDKWCKSYAENCSGGEMRGNRGDDIEMYVRNIINDVGNELNVNLVVFS